MHILYVLRRSLDLASQGDIIRRLCSLGCTVTVLFQRDMEPSSPHPALEDLRRSCPSVVFDWAIPPRRGIGDKFATVVRKALTASTYLQVRGQSEFIRQRAIRAVPQPVRSAFACPVLRHGLSSSRCIRGLRGLARRLPADSRIVEYVKRSRFDAVVACPTNVFASSEYRYVVAAKRLGIPTIVPVFSWDGLTTKDILPVVPDMVLVWNSEQREVAATLHRIPAERIVATGACRFDGCFRARQSPEARRTFLSRLGLDEEVPYLAILGTYRFGEVEGKLIREMLAAFRGHPNPHVRELRIIYRPHPLCPHRAETQRFRNEPRLVVQRQSSDVPVTADSVRDLYGLIHHGVATVAINTSAFWECIILDKPSFTMLLDSHSEIQHDLFYFQELLDSQATTCVASTAELTDELESLMQGDDPKRANREHFRQAFVRPRGLDLEASTWAAKAICMASLGTSAEQISLAFDRESDSSPDGLSPAVERKPRVPNRITIPSFVSNSRHPL